MGKAPSPPSPTDPKVSSAADQQAQTGTAIAQTWLNNPQTYTPYGTQTHTRTGTEYTTDAQGKQIEIPTFTTTQTFSPQEQRNYDYQNQINWAASQYALDQFNRISNSSSQNLTAGDIQPSVDQSLLGRDYDAYRQDALGKMREYYSPELDRQQQQSYTDLKNRGINEGSEAYREAMALSNRARSDADLQMYMGAGDEASRAFGQDLETYQNQSIARERALQEALALRNQPINEASALMGMGSGVQSPQFAQFNPGSIRPTDVAGQYNHYDQMKMQQYQAQLQAHQAKMSGMFGLGSSLIGGLFRFSDRRLKSNIVKLWDDPKGFGWYAYDIFGRREVGVLAQEVAGIVPYAVHDMGGVLAVDYGAL